MDWYRSHYLGDHPADDVRVSPLLAPVLTDLPPAYVAVSGFDVLRDEGEAYAARLAAAGVPVALRRHAGLIHAFVNSTGVGRTGREAMLEACGALRVGVRGRASGAWNTPGHEPVPRAAARRPYQAPAEPPAGHHRAGAGHPRASCSARSWPRSRWVMGNRVVQEIDGAGGAMGGRDLANIGRILGIIGTVC